MATPRSTIALVVLAATTACVDDLPEYNFIDGFRVLAVAAEDPALEPGSTTRLSALVIPGTDTTTVTYEWSWCPVTSGPSTGYECALTQAELQQQLDDAGVPLVVPPFELGTTSSVAFTYPLFGEVFETVCDQIKAGGVPAIAGLPDCTDTSFPITIKVAISDDDETITAVKEVDLLYEADPNRNNNPIATNVLYRLAGMGEGQVIDDTTMLTRGQIYELEVEINLDQSEQFDRIAPDTMQIETRREVLTFSWFINAGETDKNRSGFIEDQVPLDRAVRNEWTIPRAVDYEPDTAMVVIVVRDQRKGTSWIVRTVKLSG